MFSPDGSHVINIDDSVNFTKGKPNSCVPLIRKIVGTDIDIRNEDKKLFEPSIFSIGPYHNEKLATKAIHLMKYECLDNILRINEDKKLEDYMNAIKKIETQIRERYGDEIQMDRNNFLKMMLIDGCFLIQTLPGVNETLKPMGDIPKKGIQMKNDENMGECILDMEAFGFHEIQENIEMKLQGVEDDFHHTRLWYIDSFSSDVLLLENQIPFFVLTKIYEIATGTNNSSSLFIESIAKSVEAIVQCYPKSITAFDRPKEFYHLLHLCHMYFKPSKITSDGYNSVDHKPCHWHCVDEYRKAGIDFKKKEFDSDDPHSLLDISFTDGTMEIPCLTIDDKTKCLFLNLIAFERTCPEVGNCFTSYIVFWSQFVNTPDDVALLTKKGIIVDHSNSNAEILDIFTKLRQCVVINLNGGCYLNSTFHKIEAHCQNNKPRLKTWFHSISSKLCSAFPTVPQNL